jgi:hypothetical protein
LSHSKIDNSAFGSLDASRREEKRTSRDGQERLDGNAEGTEELKEEGRVGEASREERRYRAGEA